MSKLIPILDAIIFGLAALVATDLLLTHTANWTIITVYWCCVAVRNYFKAVEG